MRLQATAKPAWAAVTRAPTYIPHQYAIVQLGVSHSLSFICHDCSLSTLHRGKASKVIMLCMLSPRGMAHVLKDLPMRER